MIIQEVISIWAESDPVEGYAAGLESCAGKLFIPTPEAIETLRSRINAVGKNIGSIPDPDLQSAAAKLMNSISLDLASPSPERQINNCALGLWYALLKEQHQAEFVDTYLNNAERLVKFETARWVGTPFPFAVRKFCLDAADFMEASLTALKGMNRKVLTQIGSVSKLVADYRELFAMKIDPNNFAELWPLLEEESAKATPTPNYESILSECYDYGIPADQIRQQSLDMLAAELKVVLPLADRLVRTHNLPSSRLEDVYAEMGTKHPLGEDALKKSEQVMSAVNKFTNEHIQDVGQIPVGLAIAPGYLASLITSGATVVLNYLTKAPIARIYIAAEKNASWLTLLNVLAHEATHAYHGLAVAASSESDLLKLRASLSTPICEAMAFHREWEFFDLMANETLNSSNPTPGQQEMLDLFGRSPLERKQKLEAFELETRIWRLIRYLRAIFDVEVNTGMKSYVDFVNWASKETTLSKEFIHNECFPFILLPGYAPGYALCGTQYGRVQEERIKQGVSRWSFNTQAQQIAYWPWTLCLKKLQSIKDQPRPASPVAS